MSAGKGLKAGLAAVILLLAWQAKTTAFDDGLGSAVRLESAHFILHTLEDVSSLYLAQQLNMGPSDEFMAGKQLKPYPAPEENLGGMLEALYALVSDMLDMHLYEYKVNLKVCRDAKQLNSVYKRLFNQDLNAYAFYSQDLNTIYLSSDNFKRNILGHELAHAIINHYFIVAPPVKISEVLSMYVEYQLRRSAEQP